jgi:hypothetical protein
MAKGLVHGRAENACFHTLLIAIAVLLTFVSHSLAEDAPKLVQKDGRYALMVDGRPYLILGGQIHNSSGWPSELRKYGSRSQLCTPTH